MSQIKTITQINHTIESHETGHEWDDITYKIQKFTGSWEFVEIQLMGMGNHAQKTTDL